MCTGNVCRSPYIERLLAAHLDDLGLAVSSAGTRALIGNGMEDASAALLRRNGAHPDAFIARQLTPAMVQNADLVLTATRQHRREVVQSAPRGLRYTFALVDFSDLVAGADLSAPEDSEAPEDSAVAQLVLRAAARRADVAARSTDDSEILDPFRRGPEAFDLMADQVAGVLPQVVQSVRQVCRAA